MVNVLYIGQYKKHGRFTTIQWRHFIEWCKVECNKIIVYSKMTYSNISTKFSSYCNINELEKPDKILDIFAYEINIINIDFWDYIKEYDYNIDIEDDISHIFFYCEKKSIASLEIVDFENYILIEEPISQEIKFLFEEDLLLENIQACIKGKSDIDDLVQKENWKPLGYV